MSKLSLSDFSYDFPPELVAQAPLANREASRLLVRDTQGQISHHSVSELDQILSPGTVLVINDTKVFPSRLFAKIETGARIEIFLLEKPTLTNGSFSSPCFVKPGRKVYLGSILNFEGGMQARLTFKPEKGTMDPFIIEFQTNKSLTEWLQQHAYVPLPPYIKRESALPWSKSSDTVRYQTVYAREEGSVAAPTAGLHFSSELFAKLRSRGIQLAPVTLHVGAGTFLPVKSDDITQHTMHKESYYVPSTSWKTIEDAKKQGNKVVAVGTTSFRCIESFLKTKKTDEWNETDLFVYPKDRNVAYNSTVFDGIITNFHQPCSTLFMLLSSLIGLDEAQATYKEAIEKRYRLFSYGDASLFWF